ncbi:MAG: phosphate signaling complex protein PhoU [Candidatus Zixiibacteriota bacterium]
MTQHFLREIEKLKKRLLTLSALVEENLHCAIKSLLERNDALARQAVDRDNEIDQMEVDIEEECLKVLALHQPVAIDLRFLVALLKINNDLERIGDLAVNIAERTLFLSRLEPVVVKFDFPTMVEIAKSMLKRSIDALVSMNTLLAEEVCAADDEVDDMNRQMYREIQQAIREQPEHAEPLLHLLAVSRHLERIADHTTNIAEDVIYMVDGVIARHRMDEYAAKPGTPAE